MKTALILVGLALIVGVAVGPLLAMRRRPPSDRTTPASGDVGHEPTVNQDPVQPPEQGSERA